MDILNLRQWEIIQILLEQKEYIRANTLADYLNVSSRTIQTEMITLKQILEKEEICLYAKRGRGYLLDEQARKKLGQLTVQEDEAEVKQLLLTLLYAEKALDIDELSDCFYMSRTTFENELKKAKNLLSYGTGKLSIARQKNTIRIIGTEKTKRQLINALIVSCDHAGVSVDLKNYSDYFSCEELELVKNIVLRALCRNHIYISDVGIVALTIHVLVNTRRVRSGQSLQEPYCVMPGGVEKESSKERMAAEEVYQELEKRLNIHFNFYEIEAIAYHISFRQYFPTDGLGVEGLSQSMDEHLTEVLKGILEEIRDAYLMDFTRDSDLLIGITYHLKSYLDRMSCQSVYPYQNPILKDIKNNYPFIFELSYYTRDKLLLYLGINLDESEVGYIAIHFGAAVERLKFQDRNQKIRFALISHMDYPNSRFLLSKLNSIYGDRVTVYGPYSSIDLEEALECDAQFVLTTTRINTVQFPKNVQVIQINPLLTQQDVKNINAAMKRQNNKNLDLEKMLEFFKPEFYDTNVDVKTPEEVISFMSKRLYEAGMVEEGFEESVRKRETFSTTTMFPLIAMPHPAQAFAKKPVIAVALLKKPVDWNKMKTQLVFMISIRPEDRPYLKGFYELIVALSEDISYVQRLLEAPDLETFIRIIRQNY